LVEIWAIEGIGHAASLVEIEPLSADGRHEFGELGS